MLDRVDVITAASLNYPHPPAFSDAVVAVTQKVQNPATLASLKPPSFDIAGEERVLQDIVGEALAQGVWITRARRLREQELVEVRPGIRIAFMNALSHKHCEGATTVIKAAIRKELAKRE